MESFSIRKDGPELVSKRKRHREPGQVPYPVQYTSDTKDFDVWSHFYQVQVLGDLTIKRFETPPTRVLDLGCGPGIWVIEAAKKWTATTFVGFDFSSMQPDLTRLQPKSLSQRVKWVHGNFLDTLPFASGEFDFVRIRCIGMGIPEDEWQDVIDEVARVLSPGGQLEIVEEDIVFPYPNPLPKFTPISTLSQSNGSLTRNTNSSSSSSDSNKSSGSLSLETGEDEASDVRDHSALKEAFNKMLASRFITASVVSVLPLYLQAAFHEVEPYPVLHMTLPPPTVFTYNITDHNAASAFRQSMDSGILIDLQADHAVRRVSDVSGEDEQSSANFHAPESALAPSHARMALARMVQIVCGCKEAMWVEYEKLHRNKRVKPSSKLDREDFELHFRNWEYDMQDRIGMRGVVQLRLAWNEPHTLEVPPYRVWRDNEAKERPNVLSLLFAQAQPETLIVARGFVCKKTMADSRTNPFADCFAADLSNTHALT